MHIILHPVGSHGDVHPLVGLGVELKRRGHRVTLATAEPFRNLADQAGFEFVSTATLADFHAIIHDPDLWHPARSLRVLFHGERAARMFRTAYFNLADLVAPNPTDTVLVAGSLGLAARLVHERFGVPFATVHLQPASMLSVVDPPVLPTFTIPRWWPHWFRRALYAFAERGLMDRVLAPYVNGLRRELGLAPIRYIFGAWRHSPQCVLLAFPQWYASAPDWPGPHRHTPFPRFDQAGPAPLSAELEAFLAAGPPPVAVTFGTAMRRGHAAIQTAIEALGLVGQRGLILAARGDQVPARLPETCFHADYAPFSQVFTRCRAIIHHGGIGTTAQALAAGRPQLIRPMAFDQPDNAARLERLGVAQVLRPNRFTPKRVAATIQELMTRPEVESACRKAAAHMADPQSGEAAMADAVEELARR